MIITLGIILITNVAGAIVVITFKWLENLEVRVTKLEQNNEPDKL